MKNEKGSTLLIVLLTVLIFFTLGLSLLSASIGGAKRTQFRDVEIGDTINIQNALNAYVATVHNKIVRNDLEKKHGIDLKDWNEPPAGYQAAIDDIFTIEADDKLSDITNLYDILYEDVSDTIINNTSYDPDKFFTRVYKITVKPKAGAATVERTITQQVILSPTPSFLDFAMGSEDELIINGSPDIIGNIYGETIKNSNKASFKSGSTPSYYKTGDYVEPFVYGTIYGQYFKKYTIPNYETNKATNTPLAEYNYPDLTDIKTMFNTRIYEDVSFEPEIKPAKAYNFVKMNFKETFMQKLNSINGITVAETALMENYAPSLVENICGEEPLDTSVSDSITDDTYIELLIKLGHLGRTDLGDKGILKQKYDEAEVYKEKEVTDPDNYDPDVYDAMIQEIFDLTKDLEDQLSYVIEHNLPINYKETDAAGSVNVINPLIPCGGASNTYLLESDYYNTIIQTDAYKDFIATNTDMSKQWDKNTTNKTIIFADLETDGGAVNSYAKGVYTEDPADVDDDIYPTFVLDHGIDVGDEGWLIVFGNLVINTEYPDVEVNGNILVTGDLIIKGKDPDPSIPMPANNVKFDSTIYVFGCKGIEEGDLDYEDANGCQPTDTESSIYNTTVSGIDADDQLVLIANNPLLISRINEFDSLTNKAEKLIDRLTKTPNMKAFLYTEKYATLYGVGSLFDIKGGIFAKNDLSVNAIREESILEGALTGGDNNLLKSDDPANEHTNSRFYVQYDNNVIFNQMDSLPRVEKLQMIVEKPIFE